MEETNKKKERNIEKGKTEKKGKKWGKMKRKPVTFNNCFAFVFSSQLFH